MHQNDNRRSIKANRTDAAGAGPAALDHFATKKETGPDKTRFHQTDSKALIQNKMNPIITTAINQMYLPNTGTFHLYFTDEIEARQESKRTGKPVFKSFYQGQAVWSVKIK